MRGILLAALLALLGQAAHASDLEVRSPQGEIWARPGELVDVVVSGPPGEPVHLAGPRGVVLPLAEGGPGVYRGSVVLESPGPWKVVWGRKALPLGPIRLLGPGLPVAEVARDGAVYRSGPGDAPDRYDPLPAGYRFLVSGKREGWLRLEPAGGWVHESSVRLGPQAPSRPALSGIRVLEPGDGSARLVLRLGEPAPWQVLAEPESDRLQLWLPGASETMGEVQYDRTARRVRGIRLVPSERGTRVELDLGPGGLWGYRLEWRAPDLVWTLAPPPSLPRLREAGRPLEGLCAALDPGHGGSDDGAVGRDGRKEKDVNLEVCLALRRDLEEAGARVVLIRDADVSLAAPGAGAEEELGARVRRAEEAGARVFLSVHHNARPDVAEGRVAHGTHVYYYRPQSLELARRLAAPLAAALGEPDSAFLWRSFHVIRQAGMPAVLVEVNFLSNPEVEARTRQTDYAGLAAGGILQGLVDFLRHSLAAPAGEE